MQHPIMQELRKARLARGWSYIMLAEKATLNRTVARERETIKFSALAALERWPRALGYEIVLKPLTSRAVAGDCRE
jgi:hypothetical protein